MRLRLDRFAINEYNNAIVVRSKSTSDQLANLVCRNDVDLVTHHDAKRSALTVRIWTDEYTMSQLCFVARGRRCLIVAHCEGFWPPPLF